MDIVDLKREIQHLINERPQTLDFLSALGHRGKNRVLITNAHPDSVEIKFAVTGIQPLLDLVITSHDYGCPKEDQRFWQQLQQNVPFDPSRTLFIDDSEPVLRSAQAYGIAHLLAIETPDSQQQARPYFGFPAIQSFSQILNLSTGRHADG
jgi:putative hydrolase of the HAD superfamily